MSIGLTVDYLTTVYGTAACTTVGAAVRGLEVIITLDTYALLWALTAYLGSYFIHVEDAKVLVYHHDRCRHVVKETH